MTLSLYSPASKLDVPIRVRRAIRRLGCETIIDVTKIPPSCWMAQPNFGPQSFDALKHVLISHGFTFSPDTPEPTIKTKPQPKVVTPDQKAGLDTLSKTPSQRLSIGRNPKTSLHGKALKLDEIVAISIKFVRSIHLLKRTKSQEAAQECLKYEARLKWHFPSLTREEAVRMANVIVHTSSMGIRQICGMRDTSEVPCHSSLVDAHNNGVPWGSALDAAMEGSHSRRVTPKAMKELLALKGWQSNALDPLGVIRSNLETHPNFQRCSPKGAKAVYRYLKTSSPQ